MGEESRMNLFAVECPMEEKWCELPWCMANGQCRKLAESKARSANRLKLWFLRFRANWRDMLARNAQKRIQR
jgi:hypothetical protein